MVLAFGHQPVIKFGDGGAGVWVSISPRNRHQRIEFFNPCERTPVDGGI